MVIYEEISHARRTAYIRNEQRKDYLDIYSLQGRTVEDLGISYMKLEMDYSTSDCGWIAVFIEMNFSLTN